jgi:hypothetical protein
MSKKTVTRLFIGAAIAAVAGSILVIAGVWLAIANDVFVLSGSDLVAIRDGGTAWATLGLAAVGGVTVVGAVIAGLVSWIGALRNTWQLQSKTWFAVLLLLGIFNAGIIAMIAYVIAGPDATAAPVASPGLAPSAA